MPEKKNTFSNILSILFYILNIGFFVVLWCIQSDASGSLPPIVWLAANVLWLILEALTGKTKKLFDTQNWNCWIALIFLVMAVVTLLL